MLDKRLSEQVISVGCKYNPPKGGIAKVLESYSKLFDPFRFIETSKPGSNIIINTCVVVKAWFRLVFECCFGGIKIVHVHGASNRSFWRKRVFINTAKFFRKKVVYHIHGGEFDVFALNHKRAVNKVLHKVDTVVVLSEVWKQFFVEKFGVHNVVIIPNITDYPIIRKEKAQQATGLFLGLLGANKGIYDILCMINMHQNELRGQFILYVGGNGEVDKVKNLIAKYDIGDIVMYEGWVEKNRKEELLSLANIYLLPSYKEGLPISILEAMSYGMAILSTNVGSIPEVVKNNKNGFIISPGDIDGLYNATMKLVNNPHIREDMGNASKELVKPFFPDNVERNLSNMYYSLL